MHESDTNRVMNDLQRTMTHATNHCSSIAKVLDMVRETLGCGPGRPDVLGAAKELTNRSEHMCLRVKELEAASRTDICARECEAQASGAEERGDRYTAKLYRDMATHLRGLK